jgi:hypothetical protein|tara:strand:+ start:253 stop:609 length:357 start_codon:yes stop_codon:yes gene_type:complete
MADDKFKMNIKQWIELDNQHKQYNEILKEIREKKINVLTNINNHVNTNKLQDATVKISDGRIKFSVVKNVKPLTLQYIKQCLTDKLQNSDSVEKLMDYIKSNRDYTYSEDIKRYYDNK